MLYTSAEAAKLLRKLNEEKEALEALEARSSVFHAAVGEDVESVRPEYDYAAVQRDIAALEAKIRAVKHAINRFNVAHQVPGFDMTIDQMLVYIPQLTRRKQKLLAMQGRLPRQREPGYGANIIDYSYANYDIEAAREDYAKASDELAQAQTALDAANSQERMEIEL